MQKVRSLSLLQNIPKFGMKIYHLATLFYTHQPASLCPYLDGDGREHGLGLVVAPLVRVAVAFAGPSFPLAAEQPLQQGAEEGHHGPGADFMKLFLLIFTD
jgi:hypothetical protein